MSPWSRDPGGLKATVNDKYNAKNVIWGHRIKHFYIGANLKMRLRHRNADYIN